MPAARAWPLLWLLAFAAGVAPRRRVYVRVSRLVGGPAFVRLHTACFVEDAGGLVGWDFLPEKATAPETLRKLLSFQTAAGVVRELRIPSDLKGLACVGTTAVPVCDLRDRALAAPRELHILRNQCWRHSFDLAAFATETSAADVAWAAIRKMVDFSDAAGDNDDDGDAGAETDATAAPSEALAAAAPSEAARDDASDSSDPESVAVAASEVRRRALEASFSLEAAFSSEKAKRFGVPLTSIVSDEDRLQSARTASEFELALRAEEKRAAGENDASRENGQPRPDEPRPNEPRPDEPPSD
ncbi:hypothetical protein M885DRAFT_230004 [Pelagophyceae sp. CCMP2097]|nr:hypothetical protein M885DRAFT_230004 [Pelagophyceae sp. CCMP2097]